MIYSIDGRERDEWVPATDTTTDREWLSFVLSRRKGDTAEVKWNPANPSLARVMLHYK